MGRWDQGMVFAMSQLSHLLVLTYLSNVLIHSATETAEIFRHNGGIVIGSSGKPRCLDQLNNKNLRPPARGLSIQNQLCFYSEP